MSATIIAALGDSQQQRSAGCVYKHCVLIRNLLCGNRRKRQDKAMLVQTLATIGLSCW